MRLCIFESITYRRLLPLSLMRPVYELRCGILTLQEKLARAYPDLPLSLHCRPYLTDVVRQTNPGVPVNDLSGDDEFLFINGAVLADRTLADKIPALGANRAYFKGEHVVAARVSGIALDDLRASLNDLFSPANFAGLLREEAPDVTLIQYPWDLVQANGQAIRDDFDWLTGGKPERLGRVYDGAHLIEPERIHIEPGARIKPGVTLDAENGPIYVGRDAHLMSNSTVEGPCYIGPGSTVKIGAAIYENSSIGPVCKVGGEIEQSILHSYSNKQHGGFLGHAYLGSWVNLGADSNNSDLKNNYGEVRVTIDNDLVDTGLMFVGLTMGDHSKCSINTSFNTGTVVGCSSNIYGAGLPAKTLPSFCWGGSEALTTYDLERALQVAERAMGRRKIDLTEADRRLFRKVFDLTRDDRRRRGLPA